ncbi:MAG: insulinase family protein [Bacteroidales bacterium]|nr:insulinase family protein [Bacteroidales bacterium]
MKRILLTLGCIIFAVIAVFAQDLKLSDPIKADPNVKIGKLENGMTYYIRHNEYPKNRVELRLAVNAGSNQENENQRGLAHFTEHMAFNGIEGFPGNEMVDQLQKIGVVFGADLNAYTSFDETVFMIPMPLDNPNNLDMGLRILKGWAHGLIYDNKEIDAERGVISEEYRMGLGASDRMRKEWWPVLMKDSRYAERMPIGLIEVIQGFEYQVIKDFYHDWYRPDLQAVIVVGDINVKEVEQKIKDMFSSIPMPENPRAKENFPIGMNKEPLVSVCTDKEAPGSQVMLIRKFPHFLMKTIEDYRKQLMIDLYNSMYASRLEEISLKNTAPFIGADGGYDNLIGTTDEYALYASCKENKILESIRVLMQEDNRILKYGFLQTELARAKEAMMEKMERAANEVDKTESGNFADEYVDNYLHQNPIPGAKREYNLAKKMIENITIEEINNLAKDWITPENFVAIVMAPDKEGVIVPTKDEVLATIKDPKLADVTPYVDTYKEKEILDKTQLKAGTIAKTEKISAIDGEMITLSNGIQVILKKTEFKNDEILFSAYSKGGKSLYDVKDLASADFASSFIDRGGIADMDYATLTKTLKKKQAGVTPAISAMTEGFDGSSTPKDLEFFFQYLHAFFESPRVDPETYDLVMNEMKEAIKMMQSQPMFKFFGSFIGANYKHNPYYINQFSFDQNYLDQVNFERAIEIYRERFANPADFTYIFVGNFDEQIMKDYLCTYLGSLKTNPNNKENFRADVFKHNHDGITAETVKYGTEKQGWMGLWFEQPYEYNAKNNMIVTELGDIIDIYMIKVIREKMGGTYSPMVQMGAEKYPEVGYDLMVMMSCNPDKADKLAKACIKILKDLQKKGPDDESLEKVKKQLIATRAKNIQTNDFWLNYIENKSLYGDDMNAVNEYNDLVNSITKEDIVKFMQTYFKLDTYTRVDLKPEK